MSPWLAVLTETGGRVWINAGKDKLKLKLLCHQGVGLVSSRLIIPRPQEQTLCACHCGELLLQGEFSGGHECKIRVQRYTNFVPTTIGSSSCLFPRPPYHKPSNLVPSGPCPSSQGIHPHPRARNNLYHRLLFPFYKVSLHLCPLEELPSLLSVKPTLRGALRWQQSSSSQHQNPMIYLIYCAGKWMVGGWLTFLLWEAQGRDVI